MRALKFLILFSFIVVVFSCGSSNKAIKPRSDVELETISLVPDTMEVVDKSSVESLKNPLFDQYVGYLPCADCPGIDYKLTLRENGSYSEMISYVDLTEYQDKAEETYIYDGHYSVELDTVILDKKDDAVKYFLIHPDGLMLLDAEKEMIDSIFSERYFLLRKTDEMLLLTDPKEAPIPAIPPNSIDFYAMGRNPDWHLEIDLDSLMIFVELELRTALVLPVPRPEQTLDSKIANFFYESDFGGLDVTITSEQCRDELSGRNFPFNVRVEAKDSLSNEFNSYEGCGQYVVNPELENIWVLREINGEELNEDELPGGLPLFEFLLSTNRFTGFAGCNRVNGESIIKGNQIRFNAIASTKMVCESADLEQRLLNLLQGKTYSFVIENDFMVLESTENDLLKFEKTE